MKISIPKNQQQKGNYSRSSIKIQGSYNNNLNNGLQSSFHQPHTPNNFQHPFSHHLQKTIKQYQEYEQHLEQTEEQKQQIEQITFNEISDVCIQPYLKNNTKPVNMFKDKMELKKQNIQKKIVVKELEEVNKKLKIQYDVCLKNNQKMEVFLKEIQFTFKNDRSNQKANQTLLKATKTLHRQKKESKNYIQKLVKTAKTNQMRELKTYLHILQLQKARLTQQLKKQTQQNQKLRSEQDFNKQQSIQFENYQSKMTQILSIGLFDTEKIRQSYKKDKIQIKIQLTQKQVEYVKRQIFYIDRRIKEQLFNKEGLEYELEVIKNKIKEKNKRNIKEQSTVLKLQIKRKHKRILFLQQQLKQKIKTQQYIIKWTKQLKYQLEQLKINHTAVKNQFQDQINKLSRQIQQWNRKYKAQLIQQQNVTKKGQIRQLQTQKQNAGPIRKIRVVKIYQIQHLRKKLIFYIIQNNINCIEYIKKTILSQPLNSKIISLKNLNLNLQSLPLFSQQQPSQILKLARYIIEDNNNTYTKINQDQSLQLGTALLILKNLLQSDISSQNMMQIRQQLIAFLNKNFDQIRHQIWVNSGKSITFNLVNLRNAFAKYINGEIQVSRFVQYVEYMIWKKYEENGCFKLTNFQKVCQALLGRKLVKDNTNRISGTTIRSVFDKVYNTKSPINTPNIENPIQHRTSSIKNIILNNNTNSIHLSSSKKLQNTQNDQQNHYKQNEGSCNDVAKMCNAKIQTVKSIIYENQVKNSDGSSKKMGKMSFFDKIKQKQCSESQYSDDQC